MYFVHIYEYIFARFSPSRFSGSSKCFVPTPGLGSYRAPHVQCVCVRAYAHTYTHVHNHPCQKKEKNWTQENTSVPLRGSVKYNPPRQATSALYILVEHPHPRPLAARMDWCCFYYFKFVRNSLVVLLEALCAPHKQRRHERMRTTCNDCVANMYGDFKTIYGSINLHALVPRTPV